MINNPFYHDYVFTKADLDRPAIPKWWNRDIFLFFSPLMVQINDEYVFYYKHRGSRYYLYGIKPISEFQFDGSIRSKG